MGLTPRTAVAAAVSSMASSKDSPRDRERAILMALLHFYS
jgi:hypothetical protein